jgi:hypothetical protein
MPVRKLGRLNRYDLSKVIEWFDKRQAEGESEVQAA